MRLSCLKSKYRSVEIQLDRGGLFNRLAVEFRRLELVAHHRLKRGILENGLAAEIFRIVWFAVFSDRDLHHRRASYAARSGDGGINQRSRLDDLQRLKL